MIHPSDLQNGMVDPSELETRASAGEHQERGNPPCSNRDTPRTPSGQKYVPAHEWREDNCQDRDDEREAS